MPTTITKLSVFISSPSELAAERKVIISAIEELNSYLEEAFKVNLYAITWEKDIVPGLGTDPQNVINSQLQNKYDIYIGLLGTRFGTETPRAGSGTEEEFEGAYQRYGHAPDSMRVLFYFRTDAQNIHHVDLVQLQKVIEFRKKLPAAGVLYAEFTSADALLKIIREHLRRLVAEQWENGRWKVLSPLYPATVQNSLASISNTEQAAKLANALDEDNESDSAGFLDIVVSGHAAMRTALRCLENMALLSQSYTRELEPITQRLQAAITQQDPHLMKMAIDDSALSLRKFSADIQREVLIFKTSLGEMLDIMESVVQVYSADKLGDVGDVEVITFQVDSLMQSIRQGREMSQSMHSTISGLPEYTREFKRSKRKAINVFAEMSAAMTLLLDRADTTKKNIMHLVAKAKESDTEAPSTPESGTN